MAITEKNLHTKIKTVEKSGSDQVIKILYPTNYDSDVLLTDHKNTNIPSSAVTVKDVIDSVGSLAFKSSIDDATTSSSGLMSATDKQKINMIDLSTGAVGTITSVQVNGTSIASKGVANIPLANGTKTAGAILTTSAVTSATGYTASPVINGVPYYKDTITTYDDATQLKHGLMTAADKTKLDGIATGANKITIDSALSSSSTNPVQNKVITSANGVSTLLNQLTIGKDTPVDDDYFISQYVGGGTTTTTYHRRPVSALANYIKGKITIPPSLKNPHALVVKFNGGKTEGTNMFTYDGGAAKSINITPSSIGAAASSHTHTNYYSTNESRTANTVLAAPDGSNGSASFRKLTMNDIPRNYLHYYSNSMYTKGYYKIKIKSLASWMLSIYVRIYQKYQNTDLVISGYNYYTAKEHWYSPNATILGSSLDSMQIVFGYDADDYLWFTIPASDYSGIDIVDVVSGFNNPISNFNKLFEITYTETEPTTAQSRVTAYRPYLKSDFSITPITKHLSDKTAHITADERTTWNNKASSTHTHGNITNDGKVGNAASKVLTTSTGGTIVASDEGTAFNKNFETSTSNIKSNDTTASVGTATTVARADHVHPTDTTRAAAADLSKHTSNTTVHITADERNTWNAKQNKLTADTDYLTPATAANTYLKKNPDGTNNLIDTDNKISTKYLPDYILGQMIYGGTVVGNVATLTSSAKKKLGVTTDTITLTNDDTAQTGYKAHEGIYYIASGVCNIANLDINTGDWLVSTGAGWKKIDNTDSVTGIKGGAETAYRKGNVNITATNIGLGNVTNDKQVKALASGTTANHVVTWGADGATVKDSGFTIASSVPANAKFTDTTYVDVTDSAHGLMTAAMKKKLDGIEEGANKYVLKPASTTLGGVKTTSTVSSATGYTASPIIDGVVYYQNTTYNDLKGATASAPGTHGLVPAPAAGKQAQFLRGDGTWATPTDTKYDDATQSVHGLMSAADKRKLDGLVPTYVGSETPSYSCLWFDTTEA